MKKFDGDFIQYDKQKVKDETGKLAFYFIANISFYIFLLFFAIFFAWYSVFVSTHIFYAVKGPSMMPVLNNNITQEQLETLLDGELENLSFDAVYIDKYTKIRLFDIVTIHPKNGKDDYIKRVMAMEGDYITIAKSKNEKGEDCFYFYRIDKNLVGSEVVIENGEILSDFDDEMAKLDEENGDIYKIRSAKEWFEKGERSDEKTVDGKPKSYVYEKNFYNNFLSDYFDLGEKDEFAVSKDGLVYIKVPEDMFFFMGDNRAYSADSRILGFYDTNRIVGRSEFIVYNYDFVTRLWEVVKFYFSEMEKFFAR